MLLTTAFAGCKARETVDGIEVVRKGGDLLFQLTVAMNIRKLDREFNSEKRAQLALEMQQVVLDDHAFVFCSFLKMSMISKANVKNYTSHACDYYQVTADLDVE